MLTGVFIVVLLALIGCGYRYGMGVIFGRLASLVSGYLGAFFFAHPTEQWLIAHSSFKGLDSLILAMLACFFAGYFLAGGACRLLITLFSKENDSLSAVSRFTGVILGAGLGVVLGVLAVWMGGMMQDMVLVKGASGSSAVLWEKPDAVRRVSDQAVAKIANEIMRVVGHADAVTTQASSNIISEPVRVSAGLRQLANDPEFRAWLEDPEAQALMAQGDINRLMQTKNFQALTAAPQNLDALRTLQSTPTAPREEVERKFAETSAMVWQKIQRVKSSAAFQRLVEDPEIVRLVQDPNAVQLMRSEKVRALAELVFSADSTGGATRSNHHTQAAGASESPDIIYQWKDTEGHTQFGDHPPPDALNVKQIK